MHEELLKVTNELYTVSPAQLLPLVDIRSLCSVPRAGEANRRSERSLSLFAVSCAWVTVGRHVGCHDSQTQLLILYIRVGPWACLVFKGS